jgi:plastocyanin
MGKKNRRNRQRSSRWAAAAEAPPLSPEKQDARPAQQKQKWAEQNRAKQPAAAAAEAPPLSPEEQAARRARQKQEWAERKHGKERAERGSLAPLVWAGSGIAAVVVAVVVGIVLLSGGGGSASTTATPLVTADPRLGGASPVESFNVSATDDGVAINPRFVPNTITAQAGEVFQINVKNDGHSVHNLVIAGLDGQYGTNDDWTTIDPNNSSNPQSIAVGDTGTVDVKIDQPGTYKFRCLFHPDQQIGNLILVPGPSVTAGPSGSASASGSASPSGSGSASVVATPTPTPTPAVSAPPAS